MSKHSNAVIVRNTMYSELLSHFKSLRSDWGKGNSGVKVVDAMPKEDIALGLHYCEVALAAKVKLSENVKVTKKVTPKKAGKVAKKAKTVKAVAAPAVLAE